MDIAVRISEESYCNRKKVGAVLVKYPYLPNSTITSYGFNGTPTGYDNCCEGPDGNTLPEVIHAELNCILKLSRENQTTSDSILYVTLQPCLDCAKLIVQSGIEEVIYLEDYRTDSGVQFLRKMGIVVSKL